MITAILIILLVNGIVSMAMALHLMSLSQRVGRLEVITLKEKEGYEQDS
jgi:hypothetical protein